MYQRSEGGSISTHKIALRSVALSLDTVQQKFSLLNVFEFLLLSSLNLFFIKLPQFTLVGSRFLFFFSIPKTWLQNKLLHLAVAFKQP